MGNKQTNKCIIYFQLMLAAVKKNVVKRKSVMGEGCFEKREKKRSVFFYVLLDQMKARRLELH